MANRLRRGTESISSVKSKFNLEEQKKMSFVYIDGIPHKMKNGILTPLTKVQ